MASNDNNPGETLRVLILKLQDLALRFCNKENEEARRECLQISRRLTTQLERPENIAVELAYSPTRSACARIAIDLNLFEYIVEKGPITSAELSQLSGAEELLIVRILRVLSAIFFVEEVDLRKWKANAVTKAMAKTGIVAGHRMLSQFPMPAIQSAPAFISQNGYTCPVDHRNGIAQFAFKTGKTGFEYIESIPSLANDFHRFMGHTMGARQYWVDWYPVESRILNGATTDKPLFVDIGAGRGHDIVAFKKKYPHEGGLIWEDLPGLTKEIANLDTDIEIVEYDFFTKQPIKGARAYFYHHILHDWSDENCTIILENVVSAMTPGYSKLLIHDMIIPDQGASIFAAELDMTMMAFNGGLERTKVQWRALLNSVGLQGVEFWDPVDEDGDGIIEAVRL